MTRGLARTLSIEMVILAALLTVVADQVAHTHVETLGGVNVWGYRGPVLHQKKANETRIAVAGGDLAFGWGVAASETLAPAVRQFVSLALDRPGEPLRLLTSVTLGAQGLPPADYGAWIDHYAYLRPDVICLVPDPVGHMLHESGFLPDRRSLAFTLFGYSPILPLVVDEKGAATNSSVVRFLGASLRAVDAVLGRRDGEPVTAVTGGSAYLAAIETAIRSGLRASRAGVVVIVAPSTDAAGQAGDVKALVASTFSSQPVRVVDLGEDPDMDDDGLRLDHFSFSTAGHAAAAKDVAPAVLDLIRSGERRGP
jgi:hypothetical protein